MKPVIRTVEEYIETAPSDRQKALRDLRHVILEHLPDGFSEVIQYSMPSYVVPHSLYPSGYHCAPAEPLPFLSFASQKNFIALYHMGLYSNQELQSWFIDEYTGRNSKKPDMGKSCVRFKHADQIPYKLIGELVTKMTVKEWIEEYERTLKR